jgi:tRNA(Ile2) C34 agmatinyltransferase TiaS
MMAKCEHCGRDFERLGRRRYCCDACRQAAYRDRNAERLAAEQEAEHQDAARRALGPDVRAMIDRMRGKGGT